MQFGPALAIALRQPATILHGSFAYEARHRWLALAATGFCPDGLYISRAHDGSRADLVTLLDQGADRDSRGRIVRLVLELYGGNAPVDARGSWSRECRGFACHPAYRATSR